MSFSKLVKFNQAPRGLPNGIRTLVPVILSDSKGFSLKNQITNHPVDQSIEWCCESGAQTYDRVEWLSKNIERLVNNLGNIHLYVWLGTNDLTTIDKSTKHISLKHEDNSTIQELSTYYQLIAETISIFPECKLTFLEIPPFSIEIWNKGKDHLEPHIFREQDHKLCDQINDLNQIIRHMNNSLESHSPNFSLTLYQNPKYRKGNHRELAQRKTYNFNLYRDGIHPSYSLAVNWLKRISIQMQRDCWQ